MVAQNARAAARFSDNFAFERAGERERGAALAIALGFGAACVLIAPFAKVQLATVPTFLLLIEAFAVVGMTLIGSTLYAQYRARRYEPLAILGVAFIAQGLGHALYLVTFPGIFVPLGIFAVGPQSAAFVYTLARLFFEASVVLFAYAQWRERAGRGLSREVVQRLTRAPFVVLAVTALAASLGNRFLPALILANGHLSPFFARDVQPLLLAFPLVAAAAVYVSCGVRTRVGVWLVVLMIACAVEAFLTATGGGRYTVGWYVARLDVAASAILFIVAVQAQLAGVMQRAARTSTRAHALFALSSGSGDSAHEANEKLVESAMLELGFEWGFLSRNEDAHPTIEVSVGAVPRGRESRARLEKSLPQAVMSRSFFVLESANAHAGSEELTWTAFASVPVFVEGRHYGAVGFASRRKRRAPVNEADRDYMILLGLLAGGAIERHRRARHLSGLAYYDSLTGLANRTLLLDKMKEKLAVGQRYGTPFAVHFLDLDEFKPINDRFGHQVGDEVLREIAKRLQGTIRESDTVARMGGDEFVILQHVEADEADARTLALRMTHTIERPIETSGGAMRVGASVGTSIYPRDGTDAETLLACADEAQYRQKSLRRRARETPSRATSVVPFHKRSAG